MRQFRYRGRVLLHGAGQFVVLAAGGAAVGGVIAAGVLAVRRRVTDPVLETVVALITPYAAYGLGAAAHVSPVIAVIIAGLAIGAQRERVTTAQTRLQLIATRILWVFPLSAVLQRRGGTRRPFWAVPTVVSWAGTCGVVPLAAALSIPLTSASGAPLAQRDLILVLATAVIVVSFIVRGLTLEPLVRFTGIARPADARHEETVARLRLAEAALARLDELTADDAAPDPTIGRVPAPACRPASAAPAPGSTAATDRNLTA